MPGQRKRKKRQREALARHRDRFGPDAGHWEVVCSPQDETALRAEMRRLRAERPDLDEDAVRVDMLCGRLVHPTTYRLSVFVPFDADAEQLDAEQPQEA
ncbi:hypothetical protein [Streptomyces sp. R44]|uniref:Uncharacterized protein n=1 Tax=Streptomyces sp. R44 TaxID=3238633 RepID=A0AB39SYE5_9ACTN